MPPIFRFEQPLGPVSQAEVDDKKIITDYEREVKEIFEARREGYYTRAEAEKELEEVLGVLALAQMASTIGALRGVEKRVPGEPMRGMEQRDYPVGGPYEHNPSPDNKFFARPKGHP